MNLPNNIQHSTQRYRVGIIGTGAMACFFASRWAAVSDVVLIGTWPEQIAAIRARGLSVIEMDGSRTEHQIEITDQWDRLRPVDVVWVLVKSYQTVGILERIRPILTPKTPIITLQNGLGNLEILQAEFGKQRTTVGVASYGANTVHPGTIRHAGNGTIHIATPPSFSPHPSSLTPHPSSLNIKIVPNAHSLLWGKVAINAGINPLTALLNVPNGYLVEHEPARAVLRAAAQEAQAVAAAQNIVLPFPDAAAETERIARATAANRSSMRQDMERGAPTEIDAICGAIVQAGQFWGVPTPINAQLRAAIIAKEANQPFIMQNLWNLV